MSRGAWVGFGRCPTRIAANLTHPGALTASPIFAALRSTHGRGTPATPPPSGSVPHGLRPDARRGLPSTIEPLGAGSETAPQRPDCSGEWLEAGTYVGLPVAC